MIRELKLYNRFLFLTFLITFELRLPTICVIFLKFKFNYNIIYYTSYSIIIMDFLFNIFIIIWLKGNQKRIIFINLIFFTICIKLDINEKMKALITGISWARTRHFQMKTNQCILVILYYMLNIIILFIHWL